MSSRSSLSGTPPFFLAGFFAGGFAAFFASSFVPIFHVFSIGYITDRLLVWLEIAAFLAGSFAPFPHLLSSKPASGYLPGNFTSMPSSCVS
jgi:hypothetical protein